MPLAAKVLNRKKWLIIGANGKDAICPNNKPFFAETLKAGKSSGGATKAVIGEADCVIILRWRFG
jgi:hypothetical protein